MNATGQITLAGARIAVILNGHVMYGHAQPAEDETLGPVVRIDLGDSQPGNPSLIIPQSQWDAHSRVDTEHGCEFTFLLGRD